MREPLCLGQAALGTAAVGDVDAGAVEPARGPVGAHGHVRATVQDPALAIAARDAEVEVHRRLAREGGPGRLAKGLVVVLVDEQHGLLDRRHLIRGDSVEAAELRRPMPLAGLRVPMPAADPGDQLRLGQLTLAQAERVFESLAIGDVGRDADHGDGLTIGIEQRRPVGEEDATLPFVLDVERLAGANQLGVALGPALGRDRIEELFWEPADDLLAGLADELAGGAVGVQEPPVRILHVQQY